MPKPIRDIDLMLLADGELAADEGSELSAALEAHPDAQLKSRSLAQVSETVRTYLELESDDAGDADRFHGMWERIERRIQTNGARTSPAASDVVRKKPGAQDEAAPGFIVQLRNWLAGWRGHLATGLATAGAVAILMMVVRPFERVVERRIEVVNTETGKSPDTAIRHVAQSQPPEVENLEVYDGTGMILTLPGDSEDESSTAVIWISKDEAVEEDPI